MSNNSETSFIDPDRLYTRQGFFKASGVSETRLHLAKRQGVDVPWLEVGKRKFLRGRDAIALIERLAEAPAPGVT